MILSLADVIRIASFGAHEAQSTIELKKGLEELDILNRELQRRSQQLKKLLGVRSQPLPQTESDKKEAIKELGTIVDDLGDVVKLFSQTVGVRKE